MKKSIRILTALLSLMLLMGCGDSKETVQGDVRPVEESAKPVGTVSTPAPETETSEPAEFSGGTIVGGRYENSFFGLSIEFDDDWTLASREELLQLNGILADSLSDEALKEKLMSSDSFYDLYATTTDGAFSINAVIERLGVLAGAIYDEDAYADAMLSQLGDAFAAQGVTEYTADKAVEEFIGAEHTVINIVADYQGVKLYEKCICCKAGNYMACITLVSGGENYTAEMVTLFHALQ